MFFAKLTIFIALALFLSLATNNAEAQISDKFTKMDKDKNNSISWDEFKGQYSQMNKRAFDSIDTNKDANISMDEWNTFQDGHNMGKDSSPNEMKQMQNSKKDDGKPTIFMNAPSK